MRAEQRAGRALRLCVAMLAGGEGGQRGTKGCGLPGSWARVEQLRAGMRLQVSFKAKYVCILKIDRQTHQSCRVRTFLGHGSKRPACGLWDCAEKSLRAQCRSESVIKGVPESP